MKKVLLVLCLVVLMFLLGCYESGNPVNSEGKVVVNYGGTSHLTPFEYADKKMFGGGGFTGGAGLEVQALYQRELVLEARKQTDALERIADALERLAGGSND